MLAILYFISLLLAQKLESTLVNCRMAGLLLQVATERKLMGLNFNFKALIIEL
jgi:hypothetical protein